MMSPRESDHSVYDLRAALDMHARESHEPFPARRQSLREIVLRAHADAPVLERELKEIQRRLGTAAAILIIFGLVLHAMFGANGMVVYRQKRTEVQSLQTEVERLQKENSQYANQIKSLKSDPAAIEKEAREQLHYTRPGEVVYVVPDPPQKPPSGRAKNDAKNGH